MPIELRPYQAELLHDVEAEIADRQRRVAVTLPTGGGKTRVFAAQAERWIARGKRVALYTNRRLLLDQAADVFGKLGLEFGIRAAGYARDVAKPLQIASVQTEKSRSMGENPVWEKCDADLAIFDECHLFNNPTGHAVAGHHLDTGGVVVGYTASPIDLGDMFDVLVQGPGVRDLQTSKPPHLVPAHHYGPDEPGLATGKRIALATDMDTVTQKQLHNAMMTPGVYGRVLEWYRKINPDDRPTILFAPDVQSSVWFCDEFQGAGIPAAHIDGDNVRVGGEWFDSDHAAREGVIEASRSGKVKVICNRFVLREGVDLPWVSHLIFATVFSTVQSYLQSGGRGLRIYDGKTHCTVQDHGGNWWRFGSLNENRQWDLTHSDRVACGLREWHLQHDTPGTPPEPQRCECGRIVVGVRCPCGNKIDPRRRSRPVVQTDGSLVDVTGRIYYPKTRGEKPDTLKKWLQAYWRAKSAKRPMTFNQAMGLFAQTNYYHPPENLPCMPLHPEDWFRHVGTVPMSRLVPMPPKEGM
ncbi:MAG TPA: DEAD/DEAH box helicase family protein [Gemmata sp.]|jgi:superfamily II DNA or RNA helicase|nr:DEAD/DEAH box helicase family protein [Gemmata sp.]